MRTSYSLNNPLSLTDPTGLYVLPPARRGTPYHRTQTKAVEFPGAARSPACRRPSAFKVAILDGSTPQSFRWSPLMATWIKPPSPPQSRVLLLTNPKDLATGGNLERAAKAIDLMQNIHSVEQTVKSWFQPKPNP